LIQPKLYTYLKCMLWIYCYFSDLVCVISFDSQIATEELHFNSVCTFRIIFFFLPLSEDITITVLYICLFASVLAQCLFCIYWKVVSTKNENLRETKSITISCTAECSKLMILTGSLFPELTNVLMLPRPSEAKSFNTFKRKYRTWTFLRT